MSSAGHVLDMIQRLRQNREILKSKKADIKEKVQFKVHFTSMVHVPGTRRVPYRESKTIRRISLLLFILVWIILIYLIVW